MHLVEMVCLIHLVHLVYVAKIRSCLKVCGGGAIGLWHNWTQTSNIYTIYIKKLGLSWAKLSSATHKLAVAAGFSLAGARAILCIAHFHYLSGWWMSAGWAGGWVLVVGGSKIRTKLSPQMGLAKLELGLSLAIYIIDYIVLYQF